MLDTIHPLSLVFYHTPKPFTRAKSHFTRAKIKQNFEAFLHYFSKKKTTISQDTVVFFENIKFFILFNYHSTPSGICETSTCLGLFPSRQLIYPFSSSWSIILDALLYPSPNFLCKNDAEICFVSIAILNAS